MNKESFPLLKHLFILVLTVITMLIAFLIADVVFYGIVYLVVSLWNKASALNVFIRGIIFSFIVEFITTIICALRSGITERPKERKDKSGT